MATEDQIVGEDDWNYLAVVPVNRSTDDILCFIEIGRGAEAPDDQKAKLLPLNKDGVEAMIQALHAVLEEHGLD